MQIYLHYSRFYFIGTKKNKILRDQLKEMNKEGNNYIIKMDHSAEEGLTKKFPPCTDNSNTFDIYTNSDSDNHNANPIAITC